VITLREGFPAIPELTDHPTTGRTTFVNTLCGKQVLQGKDADDATNAHLEEGVRIKPVTVGMLARTELAEESG
jgi:septin family protein